MSAYDKIFEEAIASGLGQEEAVRQATAAQIAASAEVLAVKGEEYARIAAFDAAMALGANATAEERKAALARCGKGRARVVGRSDGRRDRFGSGRLRCDERDVES